MQTVVPMRDNKGTEAASATTAEAPPATQRAAAAAAPRRVHNAFVPLLLGLLALLTWLGFVAWQLERERQQLQAAHAAALPTLDTATRLRQSLDRLAADTQRLADAGNGNAKVLVDELRRRGITINPNSPVSSGAGR